MECNPWVDLSGGGDLILLSVIIGYAFSIALIGFKWYAVLVGLSSVIFHEMFKPNWREAAEVVFELITLIPKSIVIGIYTLFLFGETFEVKSNDRGIPEILSITIVPDTVVLMSDEMGHHVHKMVRR